MRTGELDSQLCSVLTARSFRLRNPADQTNPFGLFDYLLVYHPEEHTATMELLEKVEKGAHVFAFNHPVIIVTTTHSVFYSTLITYSFQTQIHSCSDAHMYTFSHSHIQMGESVP